MSATTTTVFLAGQRVKLDDALLLGQGGEARVFSHPTLDVALKIFHDAHGALASLRIEKLRAWVRMSGDVPPLVIAPKDVVVDKNGDVVGYAMSKVSGAVDIAVLAKKASRPLKNGAVLMVFRALHDAVVQLHEKNVVVGDLNDGNVVLDAAFAPHVIDADSMQIGALACPVAHERFLDPRLYGKSLVDDAVFDRGSDLYALRVLLFQSLLCLHPYGGVHAKYATLLRRAEASWSVLRGDVVLPKASLPIESLPDDMLADFSRAFDDVKRDPMPASTWSAPQFRTCTSCGIEHARSTCPACKTAAPVPAVRNVGGVREESIVDRKVVIAARLVGSRIAYVVDDRGRIGRENGALVLDDAHARACFAIDGDATWIALGSELVKVRDGVVVDRALTAMSNQGAPMFAVTQADGLFVVEGDALVHHASRVRVGRLLEGATRFVDNVGLWYAGRTLRAFSFTSDPRAFVDLELPSIAGKLVDVSCTRDAANGDALLGFAHDVDGKRMHTLALVDARGKLVASTSGSPEDAPHLATMRGFAIAHGKIVAPTNGGVLVVDVDARAKAMHPGAVFASTRDFVDATCELLPGPSGSLFVVQPTAITRLVIA